MHYWPYSFSLNENVCSFKKVQIRCNEHDQIFITHEYRNTCEPTYRQAGTI